MFKVIIAGSRTFDNMPLLIEKMDYLLENKKEVEVVCGCAKGADELGYRYALLRGYSIKEFPADWDRFGKSAGYIRNAEMVDYADAAVVFWNGESRGSKHMIDLAKEKNIPVKVIKYSEEEV